MSDKKYKILCIMPNRQWSVGDIRLVEPLSKLQEYSGNWDIQYRAVFDLCPEDFRDVSLVILQRVATVFCARLARKLHRCRIPYVYEIDDLLWNMPEYLASSKAWRRSRRELKFLLRNAVAITTSTERLAGFLRRYNANVTVIPNTLPEAPLNEVVQDIVAPAVICAATDAMHIAFLPEVLSKLQLKYPEVEIHAVGPVAGAMEKVERLNVTVYPIMDPDEFARFLCRFKQAVGTIPIDDSAFSSCKSYIKYLSYAMTHIPVVANDRPPYCDIIKNDINGVLVDDQVDNWLEALEKVLFNQDYRDTIVESCKSQTYRSLRENAELWGKVMRENMATNTIGTMRRLPVSLCWRQLLYIFNPSKYISFIKHLRSCGLGGFTRLWRKGM